MNTVTSDSPLPIDAVLPALRDSLARQPRAVLQAAPGAGKTTRVPLALLDAPWLAGRRILMLEPRRLAARAAAAYMAHVLGEAVGQTVGYRVRLDSQVGPATRIEVVTEGVLTRLLQADPALEGVGLVIFDEFHERSLPADLGLALCLQSQTLLREELRVLVMSATLDTQGVAALLDDCPVISSEGRSHPVTLRYLPRALAGLNGWPGTAFVGQVCVAVLQALAEQDGSLLVFLPGTGEIRQVERALRERLAAQPPAAPVTLAPLYGDLPQAEQDRVIQPAPPGQRKVVLATSIAETSLTIEGITVVIDAGLMRVPRFSPASGMTRLATLRVSQAAAAQRCGRAGRLGPGLCLRLWTETVQQGLVPHTAPEILEADLAPLALELAQWGVADAGELRWLDAPPAAALTQARTLLQHLGALDAGGQITPHGQAMAGLAMHPRLAHMVLKAKPLGLGGMACTLAGLLGERDIWRLPPGARDADLAHRLQVLAGAADPPAGARLERGAVQRVQEVARQWRRQLGIGQETDETQSDATGLLLAYAYPDRIAQRRPGPEPRYRLANGRGARFTEWEPLAGTPYLVVAELDGDEREARIFLAAAITAEALNAHFADRISASHVVEWDGRAQAVRARRLRRLDALVLDEEVVKPDAAQMTEAMLTGIRQQGLTCLPWTPALRNWQARVLLLRALQGDDADAWPDISDSALLATLPQWLAPFLDGRQRLADLKTLDLAAALQAMLTWEQQQALDALAPTHYAVPSGSRITLDYTQGTTPVLAVRLQEMFGASETPVIARGRAPNGQTLAGVPLLLHLLSPAQRPLQVTQDLAGFWVNSYPQIKKEMKGRYPKHVWPDDPLQTAPTRKTKRASRE